MTLTGVRNEPGIAGRIFTALAEANVNVDMIIQNEPVSTEHGADLSFTVAARRPRAPPSRRSRPRTASSGEVLTDDQIGKVSIVGAGMRSHPGVAAKVFQVARRRGDQHRDDLDVADQDLLRDRRRSRRRRRSRAPRAPSSSAPTRSTRRTRPASTGSRREPMSAAAVRLPRRRRRRHRRGRLDDPRDPRRARVPGRRARPVRLRALGRAAGSRSPAARSSVRELSDESIQGLDLVLSSAGGAVSSEWAPRIVDAGAVVVDNTSFWRMHDDVPLVVSRGQPRGRRRASRHRRQPELLDDADGRRAEADPRRGRDRAARHLDLPVGLRDRPARDRGAPRRSRRAILAGETRRRPRSTRTRSRSTSCPRSRPSRTATTTRPRSAR